MITVIVLNGILPVTVASGYYQSRKDNQVNILHRQANICTENILESTEIPKKSSIYGFPPYLEWFKIVLY